jgi:hypothetical protein
MSDEAVHLPAESRGEVEGRARMRGRRVLIVGGGQDDHGVSEAPIGNGRAISVLCAREGAAIAVADRKLERAEATAVCAREHGATAHAIAADVRAPADVERMVEDAVRAAAIAASRPRRLISRSVRTSISRVPPRGSASAARTRSTRSDGSARSYGRS